MADPQAAYADHAAILDLVRRKRDEWSKGREAFIRASYRNILFYRGQQWIKWDRTINRWRPAKLPRQTPTPVTNLFASTMDAVISVFARVEPTLNFRPGNPDEPEDRATADVAGRAMSVVEDEVGIRMVRQSLATWVGLAGGMAWLETGYDPDPIHGMTFLQHDMCLTCHSTQPPGMETCQSCGAPTLAPAVDGGGQPVGEQAPIGKMYVQVVPIFEMYFDSATTEWTQQRDYLREKSVSLDQAKSRWPQLADAIQANASEGELSWYADNLPLVGPQIDENQSGRMGPVSRPLNTRVTEQWYWALPTATYPDGLLAVIVGRQHVAYAGPLPYGDLAADGSRRPFLPHVLFTQKLVPGSGFAKTVADDLAVKQAQRNRWESIIESCGMRMGSPVWLKPSGANVTNLTGDPGNIITYNAVGPNAAKPERIQGQGIPLSFVEMIEKIDANFEELAACLTGDQEIPCLDGRTRTMETLAQEFPNGGMWVYGYDRTQNRVVPSRVERAWLTGTKRCVRVSFVEGTHVDCSYDHPFLTWDRGYVWAEHLQPDDAIVPLVFRPDRTSGYQRVLQPADGFVEPVHKMVAREVYGAPRGLVVHHRDEDKRNNLPENLEVKTLSQHQRDHQAHRGADGRSAIARKRWASLDEATRERTIQAAIDGRDTPEWRRAQSERRRGWWASKTPEERESHAAKMRSARRSNHRVESVAPLGDREVYDLQTSTHNFGTGAGVFVHNTFDVVKGQRPEGISAGIALQILQERNLNRYGPLFIMWEQAWAQWARQALAIFREFATEERLLKIQGRDGKWQVEKFMGADLTGRVDVVPEAASSVPKSSLLDRAEMEQLATMRVIDLNDPEIRYKFLEVYGRTNLTPAMALDTKNAIRENEAFEALARDPVLMQAVAEDATAARQMDYQMLLAQLEMRGVRNLPRVRPAIDDHAIHAREARNFAKSESFEALPEIVQVLVEKHAEYHQLLMIQQAQTLQMGPSVPLGFMQPPSPRQEPMSSGSSPQRMQGDAEEMRQNAVAAGF